MASTITIILLTLSAQLCLAVFLAVRIPGRVRSALRFLIDITHLVDGKRPRRKLHCVKNPRTKKTPAPLVAIDRPKPPAAAEDQLAKDVVKGLVDLGASKPTAQQIVARARQDQPTADADALLRHCFKLLRAA